MKSKRLRTKSWFQEIACIHCTVGFASATQQMQLVDKQNILAFRVLNLFDNSYYDNTSIKNTNEKRNRKDCQNKSKNLSNALRIDHDTMCQQPMHPYRVNRFYTFVSFQAHYRRNSEIGKEKTNSCRSNLTRQVRFVVPVSRPMLFYQHLVEQSTLDCSLFYFREQTKKDSETIEFRNNQ